MTNKNYIGKGKKGKYNSIQISIRMSEAENFITNYEGEKYLNAFVSKLKEKDQFGKTHTVYCLTPGAEQPQASA